jgi:hypothetical protein
MTNGAPRAAERREERRQLLTIAAGLAGGSVLSYWLLRGRVSSAILLLLALIALAGFAAYARCGRGVFLGFTLVARAVGAVISSLAVILMYLVVVVGIGGLIRLFGINRLRRDFDGCRKRTTMLEDVPPLTAAGFRRQS